MKKVFIDGSVCVGPTFSRAEFTLVKRDLAQRQWLTPLADLLALAGNPQRLKIVYLLSVYKEMCVCDLAEALEVTDSAVSQHLRKLKDKNLVKTKREAQTIYYSLVSSVFTSNVQNLFTPNRTKQQHFLLQKELA